MENLVSLLVKEPSGSTQKVMGMKMTEEMRNIAQFFMKQFPLDIDSIYHKKPNSTLEYYTFRSAELSEA